VYLVEPGDLRAAQRVEYSDGLPGDLATAHPKPAPDGSLINFSRSLPLGGFHVYRQDPNTLKRTQIAFIP
jgi:carlactone synthase/all-trans-10'-apo-beta-carotenal 13,14-cleaving dioxygenase